MRPLGFTGSLPSSFNVAGAGTKPELWKSPIPYLFGGLGVALLLIIVALIVLSCSSRKRLSTNFSGEEEKKQAPEMATMLQMEPKIVVVMAGDDKPKYLATPIPSSSSSLPC